MRDEFKPAIQALEADLVDLERKVTETKKSINRLYELAGAQAIYEIASSEISPDSQIGLRSDQFYGKVMTTAAREYLESRKAANRGPASPRDIYEALVGGGFKFDTKSEVNAMTGLRQTLRKNSSTFHKLPNGQYGLLSWYPNAKTAKSEDDEGGDRRRHKRPAKAASKRAEKRAAHPKPNESSVLPDNQSESVTQDDAATPLSAVVLKVMQDGKDWDVERLKQTNIGQIKGINGRALQGAIMGLRSRKLIVKGETGWRIATTVAD